MNAWSRILVAALPGLFFLSVSAQANVPDRVGRIAYLAGNVQFYSEAEQAWLPAELNAPVSSRNSLYTGPSGRAEIRFGGSALTLDSETQLDIQLLDDASFKASVGRGSISVRLPHMESDEYYEITAPAAQYALLRAGRYRVDASDVGSGISVFSGLASATIRDKDVLVSEGKSLSASAGDFLFGPVRTTALDAWVVQRDNSYRATTASRYVSPNMTGYEELDANGSWESDADYGTVWYPTRYVSSGWAPYRDGRWRYVAPWGWTWIDAAPWGFAPFHYGRWVLVGSRWGWLPGTYVRRPSYAPALVTFVGGTPGAAITIGARPAVSWYPLPPWESYRPAYNHPPHHARNINNFSISSPPPSGWRMVDRNRVSVNQLHGVTELSRDAFVASRPHGQSALHSGQTWRGAPPQQGIPSASPAPAPDAAAAAQAQAMERQRRAAESAAAGIPIQTRPAPPPQQMIVTPGNTFAQPPADHHGRQPSRTPPSVPEMQQRPVMPQPEVIVPRPRPETHVARPEPRPQEKQPDGFWFAPGERQSGRREGGGQNGHNAQAVPRENPSGDLTQPRGQGNPQPRGGQPDGQREQRQRQPAGPSLTDR